MVPLKESAKSTKYERFLIKEILAIGKGRVQEQNPTIYSCLTITMHTPVCVK